MTSERQAPPPRSPSVAAASLVAAIERATVDLALSEEPARFAAALDGGAPAASPGPSVATPGGTEARDPVTLWPDWSITALAAAIRARQVSPVEVTRACLERIERLDPTLRAFITVDADGALAAAEAREAELRQGRSRGPLHGVPLAYKDLCIVAGLPTSCGTLTADYFVAEREATAVTRLTAAGAITLGKLNMTELALGPFGDNAHRGDVQNPWRRGYVSGGSSSGSGAAVAAGLAAGALGTDTGGSIRLPAASCGIVGLKPTYGRVSRAGIMPLSWSLDHLGPMTRTAADAALLLGVIAGHDERDATSSHRPVPDYLADLAQPIAGLRLGVPENYYWEGVVPEATAAVRTAIALLGNLGAEIRDLHLPDPRTAIDVSNVLARCESAAVHARLLREQPHALQPAVRARLEVGLQISAFDYLQAARLRARLARTFVRDVFADVDALVMPTIPTPALTLAAAKAGTTDEIVQRMGRFSRLTRPWNTLGLPAVSVPCGFSAAGLPLALQIVGRPFDEGTILRLAHVYGVAAAGTWSRPLPDLTAAEPR